MIHQPWSGGIQGQAGDIDIHAAARSSRRVRRLNEILSTHTGQPIEQIAHDTDRDNFMGGESAVKYGIIDHVLETRGDLPMEAVAKT